MKKKNIKTISLRKRKIWTDCLIAVWVFGTLYFWVHLGTFQIIQNISTYYKSTYKLNNV